MDANVIVVPLDGSPFAEAVLPYAETVALATGRRLRLLSVVESLFEGVFSELMDSSTDFDKARNETAHRYLRHTAKGLLERGLKVETKVAAGTPREEIHRAARRRDVAMIALSTHGRSGMKRWVLGSVADKVMRGATKSVMLVRPHGDAALADSVALRRILVPLDGSRLAKAALEPAALLAVATKATLVLIQVVPYSPSSREWDPKDIPELVQIEAAMVSDALEPLEELRDQLPAGLHSEVVVLRGAAAVALDDYIREHQIDLTVMTTHGRGGFSRLALGSTADRLVHAGVPVLLLHGERVETAQSQAEWLRHPAAIAAGR